MKNTRKILFALLVLMTLLVSMATLTSYAADGDVEIFLTPNSNWRADNARFAIYAWKDNSDYMWIDMTDSDGNGVYEGILPAGYTNLIFCRMDPSKPNGWSDNKTWNQTNDLVYDGTNNHYKIATGAWSNGEGSWSVFDSTACVHSYENDICTKCGEELFYIIAGNVMKADGVYADGDNSTLFVSEWDVSDENNRMFYDTESECYVKIYENVAKGEYHFKVAENKSWDISYGKDDGNCYLNVEEDGSTVVITFKDGTITCASAVLTTPDESGDPEQSEKPNEPDTPDGSNDPDEPEVKLNFFQRIWKAIVDFFKNLFGLNK